MPIRQFLEGQVFGQDLIDNMSKALAGACRELGLQVKNDPAVQLVAKRIIAMAKEGIHEPALLKAAVLKGLGPAGQH